MKCKQAEMDAIGSAAPDYFVPLLEVPAASKAPAIAQRWTTGDLIWVQALNINGEPDADFANDTQILFDELRAGGVNAVPTVVLDETAESSQVLAGVIAQDQRGAVLRLDAEDLVVTSPATVQADIDLCLAQLGLRPKRCDLILDASLVRDSVAARVATIESAMTALPYLSKWRSFVVAFSAFPDDMGAQMGKDTVQSFSRTDRGAYRQLVARGSKREPVYADFGVGQPTYADMRFAPIPNIKYTDVAEWQVHRGGSRSNPSPQYIQLAQDLSSAHYFRGRGFSAGDDYLADVANGSDGPGNATTYLRAAMSHHIAHVLDHLANHGEP